MTAAEIDWTEAAEARLLDAAIQRAPTLGWNRRMLTRAAADAGLSAGEAMLVAPGGARDLAALLSRRHDARALAALGGENPAALKVRMRIRKGVEARMEAAFADEAALRRWVGFLALPPNAPLAARLVWETADRLWRWAGDMATDENHYSKRAILAGVLASTLAVRLREGRAAGLDHLDRQIDHVMAFETWKAGFKPAELATTLAGALGRLRYRG